MDVFLGGTSSERGTNEEKRESASAGYDACDWSRPTPTAMIGYTACC